jgi:hypothetical protein
MEACPKDAPVELSDGTIIKPEDSIRLKDLCEIVPLILETIAGQNAQGGKGGVTPGAPVPISGRAPGAFTSPVAPGFGGRPGSITGAPGFGQPGQAGGGGGGGGFGGGGGGGRGPAGPPGPAGPQGPAGAPGLGSILGGQLKTSGSFTVAGAPQVIPNYFVNFTVSRQGNVTIRASANFNRPGVDATLPDIQFGLQVDGTNYILAELQEQQGAGDDHVNKWHLMIELFLENMAPGDHVVRGIYSGGSIGGDPMTFIAEPDLPAVMVVQGP